MWQQGYIPRGVGWTILVLILKGNMDTRGICLLESMWKVVEAIIDTCLRSSVHLHDVLHGFHAGRVGGAVILELKLAQELDSIEQDPLLAVFLDLCKEYDTVDRGYLLKT